MKSKEEKKASKKREKIVVVHSPFSNIMECGHPELLSIHWPRKSLLFSLFLSFFFFYLGFVTIVDVGTARSILTMSRHVFYRESNSPNLTS